LGPGSNGELAEVGGDPARVVAAGLEFGNFFSTLHKKLIIRNSRSRGNLIIQNYWTSFFHDVTPKCQFLGGWERRLVTRGRRLKPQRGGPSDKFIELRT
jgi:hypothetical protein